MENIINLVLPNDFVEINESEHIYFLAGPISGGDDWQQNMISALSTKDPGCFIASPRIYYDNHPMAIHRLPPTNPSVSFSRQLSWERSYMMLAAKQGCLVFWLPCESITNPRPKKYGPYAQNTYGEIGMWRIIASNDPSLNLAIGAEDNFPGIDIIKANINSDFGQIIQINETLDETADYAVRLAKIFKTQ